MHNRTRTLLAALTAALALAGAVNSASANRLSISSGDFRIIWSPLTFGSSSGGGGTQVVCNITLEGSFHYRTIVKVLRSLIGYVTKARFAHPCSGSGEFWTRNGVEANALGTFSNTLPWHLTYEGFQGRLPEISAVRLLFRPDWVMAVFGVLCGYNSNFQGVVSLGRSGEATSLVPDALFPMGKTSGGFLCPGSLFYTANAASSRVTTQTGAVITIRLI
jgi:hypothetical protein